MELDHATETLVFAELGRFLAPVGLLSTAVAHRWFADVCDGKIALALTVEEPGPLRVLDPAGSNAALRSEEHTSELQSLMRISYAVFCLKKKTQTQTR